jgi:NitT/TauT family transport system substrate-binding protein
MIGFTRRSFLQSASAAAGCLAVSGARAATPLVRATYGGQDVLYAADMVAFELGLGRDEGIDLKLSPADAGAKARQILAAGEVDFAHGDATHPLQLSRRGKPAKMLMATELIASYANVVVRQDLFDQGITSVAKLADWKRPNGAKPIVAASAIGSGTWMFGTYIFERVGAGRKINWVGGGGPATILGGLQTKQFDAVMCAPSVKYQAEDRGWGKAIFDVSDPATWNEAFGGPIPVATIYALETTIADTAKTQAFVNTIYRAMKWLKDAPIEDIYAKIGSKYLGELDPDAVKRNIAYYKKIWNYSGEIPEDAFKRAANVWYREGTDLQETSYQSAVDTRFIDNARRKFG